LQINGPDEILLLMLSDQKGGTLLIIVMVVLLTVVGGGAYYLGISNSQFGSNQTSQQYSIPAQIITSENTSNNQPEEKEKTYSDASKLLSFKAPLDWKVSNLVIPKGSTSKNPESGYDVSAVDGDVEIINIKKGNDWTITATLKKDFSPNNAAELEVSLQKRIMTWS
jgi:hypothetical protein